MVYDYDDDLFKPLPLLEGRVGVEAMDAASESDKDVHLMLECGDNEDPSGMQRYDEDLLHIEPIDVYSNPTIEPIDIYSCYDTAQPAARDEQHQHIISNDQGGNDRPGGFAAVEDFVSDLPKLSTICHPFKGNNHAFGHNQYRSSLTSDHESSMTGDLTYYDQQSDTTAGNESSHRNAQSKGYSFYSFYGASQLRNEGVHTDHHSVYSAPANITSARVANLYSNGFGSTTKSSSGGGSLLNRKFDAMNCVSENEPSVSSQYREQTGHYSHYSMSANEAVPCSRSHLSHYCDPSDDGLMTNFSIAENENRGHYRSTYHRDSSRKRRMMSSLETASCESMPINLPSFPSSRLTSYQGLPLGPGLARGISDQSKSAKSDRHCLPRARKVSLPATYDAFDNASVKSTPTTMPPIKIPSFVASCDEEPIVPAPIVDGCPRDMHVCPDTVPDTLTVALPAAKPPKGKRTSVLVMTKKQALEKEKMAEEKQWEKERIRIVTQEDGKCGTRFSNAVLTEFCPTTFKTSDNQGKRKGLEVGFPGLSCYHCNGLNTQGGRYFPSTIKTMADTNKTLMGIFHHLLKCKRCPPSVLVNLSHLRLTHASERKIQRYGSQKAFFMIIWNRLHVVDTTVEEAI
jgi:hypothetical protein